LHARVPSDGRRPGLPAVDQAAEKLSRFGYDYGNYNTEGGPLDGAQFRNVLRRVEGEARNHHLKRQRADAGYGET
jgi:hypothetical protein